MKTIDKNSVLDVLNNLEVVEEGSEGYILVENNSEAHEKLNALGVASETINKYGDEGTFCIIALAFTEGYASDFVDGKLVASDSLTNENSNHKIKMAAIKGFTLDEIDGCEFVKSKVVGKMIISNDQNFDGLYTGKIRVVYADGSHTSVDSEEAQERLNNGEWIVYRY